MFVYDTTVILQANDHLIVGPGHFENGADFFTKGCHCSRFQVTLEVYDEAPRPLLVGLRLRFRFFLFLLGLYFPVGFL